MKNEYLTVFKNNKYPRKKILFLGYNRDRTKLIDFLLNQGCEVHYTDKMIDRFEYDLIVCFGYRKILKSSTLAKISCPIINLHISYLPYNRGAHPNFWSFIDNTPKGISIHEIDSGIDTGKIIFRQKIKINPYKKNFSTFKKTHAYLINQVEKLFIKKFEKILMKKYKSFKQKGKNTYHLKSNLPAELKNWNTNIIKFKKAYIKNHLNK